MGRNGNLFYQTNEILKSRLAIGESKHADKIKLKEDGGTFGQSTYKIYSWETYHAYKEEAKRFCEYLRAEIGVKSRSSIINAEQYAVSYLNALSERGVSIYALKKTRSALGMLYGHTIDIKLPKRTKTDIKRSRIETASDKHFSRDGKHKDLFMLAVACGGRRGDIRRLTADKFHDIDGHLYVEFLGSKGGRDRLAPVLPSSENAVRDFLATKKHGEILFPKIDKNIDVHALRREYAQKLHEETKTDKQLRDELLSVYPARNENVKRDYYKTREGLVFNRDDVYLVTQALGHNRLDVSVTHYLTT